MCACFVVYVHMLTELPFYLDGANQGPTASGKQSDELDSHYLQLSPLPL